MITKASNGKLKLGAEQNRTY